ncbi:sce7726 family protein [Rhodococcus sp. NPDC057297]|uniref:sce7726 family protein n=1 Tax=Rhodococcus sp. NPDC057297 TaxID=3346090 RepID=UPI00362F8485
MLLATTRKGSPILTQAAVGHKAKTVVSPATLRRVMRGDRPPTVDRALHSLSTVGLVQPGSTRADAIDSVHRYLATTHKVEHVYKSALAQKRFLGPHSPASASILTEFSIGSSCIDTIIVNGRATGYEIKTELDSPAKLNKQIIDYYKAFRYLYVVVDHSENQRYLDILGDTSVGILALTKRGHLSETKLATENCYHLDTEAMMKSLRKAEYSTIVSKWLGYKLKAYPVDYFRTHMHIASQMGEQVFQKLYEDTLRQRTLKHPAIFDKMPCTALRHVYLQLNPTRIEYKRIDSWLMERID